MALSIQQVVQAILALPDRGLCIGMVPFWSQFGRTVEGLDAVVQTVEERCVYDSRGWRERECH